MPNLKAVHLFDGGTRYPQMISQGVWSHPDISVSFSKPFVSLGKVICNQSLNLFEDLLESDLIFRSGDLFFNHPEIDSYLTEKYLWNKVLYYDFKDASAIDNHRLDICGALLP